MKIFVAYGYNDRDRWVEDLVFPIIRAFGAEVVTGEDLQGEQITEGVIEKIRNSDALIAFTTRRDQLANGQWITHRWVTDEISQAISFKLPVAEVREQGVDHQGGIAGDRQRIEYQQSEREKCLVELVKTIGNWCRGVSMKLQLLPSEFVDCIRPFLKQPGLHCAYTLLEGSRMSEEVATKIVPIKGGLFINTKGIPSQALIQVRIEAGGMSWTSDFESVDSLNINLKQD